MTGVARAHFESLRTLAAAGISASYAAVGSPLTQQVRAFCITNNTQGDMIFSLDNTSNNRFEEPETPMIPEPSSVNKAIVSMCEIPFIGFSFSFLSDEI